MLYNGVTQPDAVELQKLHDIAKGMCPKCQSNLHSISDEGTIQNYTMCEKCPFKIQTLMYNRIMKQYGKKDGN